MNCYFCSNPTNYRLQGMTQPAGIFYCRHCTKTHNLHRVIISVNVHQNPMEAHIYVDQQYLFRIDYYYNKTYLLSRQQFCKEETIITADKTNVTPANALNKFKTYLLFS